MEKICERLMEVMKGKCEVIPCKNEGFIVIYRKGKTCFYFSFEETTTGKIKIKLFYPNQEVDEIEPDIFEREDSEVREELLSLFDSLILESKL